LKGRDLGDEYIFYDSSGEMYEVDEETARSDVLETARQLIDLELLA
jgi:hypothetical protein